jgi:dTMP kinase
MPRGLFITGEGTDGSGKTTQLSLIRDYIEKTGREIVFLREPGGTKISEQIRDIILKQENTEMSSNTEMFLYAAARAQLIEEVIRPALQEGKIVICDRFVDSTYAYQGYGRELPLEMLVQVNKIAVGEVMPDATFFFDLNPEAALERKSATAVADRIESEEIDFHRRVYEGYIQLAKKEPERIYRIDSNRPIEAVWNDVKAVLDSLFEKWCRGM